MHSFIVSGLLSPEAGFRLDFMREIHQVLGALRLLKLQLQIEHWHFRGIEYITSGSFSHGSVNSISQNVRGLGFRL